MSKIISIVFCALFVATIAVQVFGLPEPQHHGGGHHQGGGHGGHGGHGGQGSGYGHRPHGIGHAPTGHHG